MFRQALCILLKICSCSDYAAIEPVFVVLKVTRVMIVISSSEQISA